MAYTSLAGLLIFAVRLLLIRSDVAIARVSFERYWSSVCAGGRLSRHRARPLALHNPETDDAPARADDVIDVVPLISGSIKEIPNAVVML